MALTDIIYNSIFLMILLSFLIWFFLIPLKKNKSFIVFSSVILLVKVLYVIAFYRIFPEMVTDGDAERYLFEMKKIGENPFLWNPLTGTGPDGYSVTAKMGMPYLYGWIIYIFKGSPLFIALSLNILFSYFTSVVVYFLSLKINKNQTVAVFAMLLSSIYPEILYWSSMLLRENISLLLVALMVYLSIHLWETKKIRYAAIILVVLLLLFIIRIQLIFILPIIIFYYLLTHFKLKMKNVLVVLGMGIMVWMLYPFVERQIIRAVGSDILQFLTLDPAFWMDSIVNRLIPNLGQVLALIPRGSLSSAGLLYLPFSLFVCAGLIVTALYFKKIFHEHSKKAGLLLFISICFILILAFTNAINIRFRSTIAPLYLVVVASSMHYLYIKVKESFTKNKEFQ
jgi:Dolichyl-phosphate-mannose-protein mannosyltransferase